MMHSKTQKDWDKFYLDICERVSQLSYAEDKKVGALVVKDDNIISFSYNGTARGSDNNTQESPVLHAEVMAIAKVAKSNQSTRFSTLYTTLSPCLDCAKLIYASGITRVVYLREYKCMKGIEYLMEHDVTVQDVDTHTKLFKPEQLRNTGLL